MGSAHRCILSHHGRRLFSTKRNLEKKKQSPASKQRQQKKNGQKVQSSFGKFKREGGGGGTKRKGSDQKLVAEKVLSKALSEKGGILAQADFAKTPRKSSYARELQN